MAVQGHKVVLVTSGSGLVGRGIQEVVAGNPVEGEKWVFLSSKVGYTSVHLTWHTYLALPPHESHLVSTSIQVNRELTTNITHNLLTDPV